MNRLSSPQKSPHRPLADMAALLESLGFRVTRKGRYAVDIREPVRRPRYWATLFCSPCGGLELTYLWVARPARREGWGRWLLNVICASADATGTMLWLWAKPFRCRVGDPLGNRFTLAAWYAREEGFRPTRGIAEAVRMVRDPLPIRRTR